MSRETELVFQTLKTRFDIHQDKLDKMIVMEKSKLVLGLTKPPNIYHTELAFYRFVNGLNYPVFNWRHADYKHFKYKHFDTGSDGRLIPNFQVSVGEFSQLELRFDKNDNPAVMSQLCTFFKGMEHSMDHRRALVINAEVNFAHLSDNYSWFAVEFYRPAGVQEFIDYANQHFKPEL